MTSGAEQQSPLVQSIWQQLKCKDDTFVIDCQKSLTARELCEMALRFAATIRQSDQFGEIAVPIVVGRRLESVAAILGALLAGKAFAPLSNAQPPSRLQACMTGLNATAALSGLGHDEVPAETDFQLLSPTREPLPETEIDIGFNSDDLLYVLFTSGSTGTPKGVMCSHNNILNTLLWSETYLDWNDEDRIGVATQFSFDIAMFDLFTALYRAVPLVLLEAPNDPQSCLKQMADHNISSIFSVPFFFSQFVRGVLLSSIEKSPLRRILSGGDFFSPPHVLSWLDHAPSVEILNVWGPTETSIVNTMHVIKEEDRPRLEKGQSASVGAKHPRMMFTLLEPETEGLQIASGQEGEIAMLGQSVSMGYLNDPELTARQYFEHEGQRGFRTGDLGRLEGEELFIEGRIGTRVKIAGHRIDLAEVEAAATKSAGIYMTAAFVHESVSGVNEIWCCVQTNTVDEKLDIFSLKSELRKRLPRYMVPKRIFQIEKMPLNANGKIDRGAAKTTVLETQ